MCCAAGKGVKGHVLYLWTVLYTVRLAKRRAGWECAKTVRKVSAKRVVRRFGEHVCIPPVGLIFECAK